MQKSPCLGAVSCKSVCCWWGRQRGVPGALRDVHGDAWRYNCAIGRAERRGRCVVVYSSYEERKRFERVAKLWWSKRYGLINQNDPGEHRRDELRTHFTGYDGELWSKQWRMWSEEGTGCGRVVRARGLQE